MDLDIITKNIQKMTTKEKVSLIQTLFGVSGRMAQFLSDFQNKSIISFPPDVHYMMMVTYANLYAISEENTTPEIMDFSLKLDSSEEKLISILKQMNKIYKDKLDER